MMTLTTTTTSGKDMTATARISNSTNLAAATTQDLPIKFRAKVQTRNKPKVEGHQVQDGKIIAGAVVVAFSITQAAVTIEDPQSKIKARRHKAAADKRAGSSIKATAKAVVAMDVELICIITTITTTATHAFRMILKKTLGMKMRRWLVDGTNQIGHIRNDLLVAVMADRESDSKVGTGMGNELDEGAHNSQEEASRERVEGMAAIEMLEVKDVSPIIGHSVVEDQEETGRMVERGQQGIGRLEMVGQ